jgi:hypothetical protein
MVLRNKGIPSPIGRGVQSFVNKQETRIRIDRFTDSQSGENGMPMRQPGIRSAS